MLDVFSKISMFSCTVDIYFENFTSTKSENVKRKALEKLERFVNQVQDIFYIKADKLARAHITLAKMRKELGGSGFQQAMRDAEQAFRLCTVYMENGWTLRAFSHVLSFAGLEVDAQIALSLTFSILPSSNDINMSDDDDFVVDVSSEPDEMAEAGNKENLSVQEIEDIPSHPDIARNAGDEMPGNDEVDHNADAVKLSITPNTYDASSSNLKINGVLGRETDGLSENRMGSLTNSYEPHNVSPEPKGLTTPVEDEATPAIDSIQPRQQPDGNGDTEIALILADFKDVQNDVGQEPKSPDQRLHAEDLAAEEQVNGEEVNDDDQDAVRSINVYCRGTCLARRRRWKPNSSPWYHCMSCYSVDFCPDCKAIQEDFFTNNSEGFWYKVCWGQHKHLRQPIEGWKGVKDGVIRIGRKHKHFRDWLKEVNGKWAARMMEMTPTS